MLSKRNCSGPEITIEVGKDGFELEKVEKNFKENFEFERKESKNTVDFREKFYGDENYDPGFKYFKRIVKENGIVKTPLNSQNPSLYFDYEGIDKRNGIDYVDFDDLSTRRVKKKTIFSFVGCNNNF